MQRWGSPGTIIHHTSGIAAEPENQRAVQERTNEVGQVTLEGGAEDFDLVGVACVQNTT